MAAAGASLPTARRRPAAKVEVARNPATPSAGITTLGQPWLLGGYQYAGKLDQLYAGWIGDIRIVDRPLPVSRFMVA